MLITAVRLENIRGFRQRCEVDFTTSNDKVPRWIVIAGRNGAGKSTFLQAIALTIVGPSVARVMSESFAGWISNGATEAVAASRLQYSDIDFFAQGRRPKFTPWSAVKWTQSDSGPEPSVSEAKVGGNWTALRGPWAENFRGWFLAGYGPFRRLSNATTEAQRLMMSPGRPSSLASLFREEASLSEAVQWLQRIYLRRLEERPDALRTENSVLKLLDDGLLAEGMRVKAVNSDGLLVVNPSGTELLLRSMSDGYRTVAALVLDIIKQLIEAYGDLDAEYRDDRFVILHEGVVLIDEIDVHLHVSWQQSIGFWLKDHFPNLQFIVTTHSPFICQAADEGGLIRLPAPGETGPPTVVAGELFRRVVNGSAEDAVLSELFGLENSYSKHSAMLRDELAELETSSDNSPADAKRIEALREALPNTLTDEVSRSLNRLTRRV